MPSELLFARFKPKNLEPKNSIGSKWDRLLDALGMGREENECTASIEGKYAQIGACKTEPILH